MRDVYTYITRHTAYHGLVIVEPLSSFQTVRNFRLEWFIDVASRCHRIRDATAIHAKSCHKSKCRKPNKT